MHVGTVNLAPPTLFQDLAVVLCKLLDLFSNYPQNSIYMHQSFEQNSKWILLGANAYNSFKTSIKTSIKGIITL